MAKHGSLKKRRRKQLVRISKRAWAASARYFYVNPLDTTTLNVSLSPEMAEGFRERAAARAAAKLAS